MSINDNGIMDTLKENPENGFRMLMTKYQETYIGISADWWFRMMMHRMPRRKLL